MAAWLALKLPNGRSNKSELHLWLTAGVCGLSTAVGRIHRHLDVNVDVDLDADVDGWVGVGMPLVSLQHNAPLLVLISRLAAYSLEPLSYRSRCSKLCSASPFWHCASSSFMARGECCRLRCCSSLHSNGCPLSVIRYPLPVNGYCEPRHKGRASSHALMSSVGRTVPQARQMGGSWAAQHASVGYWSIAMRIRIASTVRTL